jgi:hypothetical protein
VNTEENKHKTRGSNSEFSWSKLTAEIMLAADHETGDASKLDQVKALAVLAVRRPPLVPTPPIRRTQSDVAKSARTAGATQTA